VIHVAGPVTPNKQQLCARCGRVLKDFRVRGVDVPEDADVLLSAGGPYPIGALIDTHIGWQAMYLGPGGPECS
jgi:hypothetical protein